MTGVGWKAAGFNHKRLHRVYCEMRLNLLRQTRRRLPVRGKRWCEEQQVELFYIEPGRLDQNAFVERFNRTCREEVLDPYLLDSLERIRDIAELCIREYNEQRPHDNLGFVPPLTYSPGKQQESLLQNCVLDGEAFIEVSAFRAIAVSRSPAKPLSDSLSPQFFLVPVQSGN